MIHTPEFRFVFVYIKVEYVLDVVSYIGVLINGPYEVTMQESRLFVSTNNLLTKLVWLLITS